MSARVKRSAAALLGLTLLAVLAKGLSLARYEPVTSDRYAWGAFHVHSTLSDGLKPLEEIAVEAKAARLSFVLLSEHGRPHPEASVLDETMQGVRFIGGSEVGLPEGHVIVSDVDRTPRYTLPPYPPDAVDDVSEWGGFTVVTYPEDPVHRWRYWEDDFLPDGIEIINVTSYFRASSHWTKLMWAVFSMFNSYYYVSSFEPPAYALARWDEMLARGRVVPLYAANAHGGFPISDETTIGVPSYRTVFSYVGLGIDHELAHDPAGAIRRGQFFAVIRGAGEPDRFELDVDETGVRVLIEAATLSPRIVLKRDGAIVAESNESELHVDAEMPGVYRAEVYLDDHPLLSDDVPWILSNPTYWRTRPTERSSVEPACDHVAPLELGSFHVEKDEASTATLEMGESGELVLSYHLSQATDDEVDRWVALARREPLDGSLVRGIYVRGETPEPMRFWVDVRSGDDSYYGTVKLTPGSGGDTRVVPWTEFYRVGGGRETPPIDAIDALFLSVNTSNVRTGFSSSLTLFELGGCR